MSNLVLVPNGPVTPGSGNYKSLTVQKLQGDNITLSDLTINTIGAETINTDTINGIVIQSHASRHAFNGADPLTPALVGDIAQVSDSTSSAGTDNTKIPRADHQHAHGNRGGGTLHATATTLTAGFMSAADKIKVDSVPAGSDTQILYNSGGTALGGSSGLTWNNSTSTLTATNGVFSTLNNGPKYILADTFATYGDSFTVGVGSESGTTWPAMLATLSGNTAVNNAVSGTTVDYITANGLFNNVLTNSTYNAYSYIIAYGFNDVRNNAALYNETSIYQWYQVYLNVVLAMAMKQNLVNIARSGWTETGAWADTGANNYGRNTTVNGATSTKTITGRYYMFSFLSINTSTVNWSIQIDGVTKATELFTFRAANATFYGVCVVIDMKTSAARSCKVINNGTGGQNQYFEFCAAWDTNSTFRNVLCCSIPMFDFAYTGGAPNNGGSQSKWNTMNTLIQQAVTTCQGMGLPVYFYKDLNTNCFASDGLHWSDGAYYDRAYGIYTTSTIV